MNYYKLGAIGSNSLAYTVSLTVGYLVVLMAGYLVVLMEYYSIYGSLFLHCCSVLYSLLNRLAGELQFTVGGFLQWVDQLDKWSTG